MWIWRSKVRVGTLLGAMLGGGWADMYRFRMCSNHGGRRSDVQRDGIRKGAGVHVRIRWVMAMRARLGTTRIRRGWDRVLLAL